MRLLDAPNLALGQRRVSEVFQGGIERYRLPRLIAQLYGNGEQGAMYIPKPQVLGEQVLFQDAAGTTPVESDGDPVGLMLDLSGNDNHASQEVSGARPIYRTGGGKHWLEFDGASDQLVLESTNELRAFDHQQSSGFYIGVPTRILGDRLNAIISKGTSSSDSGNDFQFFYNVATEELLWRLGSDDIYYADLSATFLMDVDWDSQTALGTAGATTVQNVGKGSSLGEDNPIRLGARERGTGNLTGYVYGVVLRSESCRDDGTYDSVRQYLASLAGVTL